MRLAHATFFFFTLLTATSSAGELTHFVWSNVSVDAEPILRLGRIPKALDVIEAIRNDSILKTKVFILEYRAEALEGRDEEDLGKNVHETQERITDYYTKHRLEVRGASAFPGDFAGVFLAKFAAVPNLPDRPLLDENILLVIKNAPRETILHESVHAMIESKRREEPVLVDGIKTHVRNARRAKYVVKAKENERADKALLETLPTLAADQREAFLAAHYSNGVDQMRSLLQIMSDSQGEEIDVTRFLEDHKVELGLTKKEAYENFKYSLLNFISIDKGIKTLNGRYFDLKNAVYEALPKKNKEHFHHFVSRAPKQHGSSRIHQTSPVAEHLAVGNCRAVVATPVERYIESER